MTLIPKNWAMFQHYKDRAPAWIKLHRGLLDDFAFSRLPVASRALAPLLWLLASEYEHGKITATIDEIAFRFRLSSDELNDALKPLIESGFFVSDSKPLARRKRVAILEEEREIEKQVETEKNIGRSQATRPKASEEFEEFWKAYPRRLGANPKVPASKVYDAAVRQGADPKAIIEGARRCAVSDHDKIGTPYIPQAVKWLRDKRWNDYAAEPSNSGLSEADRAKMFAELRGTDGQSSKRTDLRGSSVGSCESEPDGREEPTAAADHQTRNAGMAGVGAIFREPLGLRACGNAESSVGDEQGIHGARAIARAV